MYHFFWIHAEPLRNPVAAHLPPLREQVISAVRLRRYRRQDPLPDEIRQIPRDGPIFSRYFSTARFQRLQVPLDGHFPDPALQHRPPRGVALLPDDRLQQLESRFRFPCFRQHPGGETRQVGRAPR